MRHYLTGIFFLISVVLIGQTDTILEDNKNVIVLRPFGLLAFYDPGLEINYYRHLLDNNFTLHVGYKHSSSRYDFLAKKLYEEFNNGYFDNTLMNSYFVGFYTRYIKSSSGMYLTTGPQYKYSLRSEYEEFYIDLPNSNKQFKYVSSSHLDSKMHYLIWHTEFVLPLGRKFIFVLGLDPGIIVSQSEFRRELTISELSQFLSRENNLFYPEERVYPYLRFRVGVGYRF